MLGGIGDKIKGLFVKQDGSMNWKTLIGLGIGAAVGGMGGLNFVGLQAGGMGALVGAGIGLGGSALVSMVTGGSDTAASDTPTAPTRSGGQAQGGGMAFAPQPGLPGRGQVARGMGA
ncbi:MAG: hypothetical protein K2Q01_11560 [Rickettsiales bacterium]|nr:hypothetical protein [Rickettsiales bacterium]